MPLTCRPVKPVQRSRHWLRTLLLSGAAATCEASVPDVPSVLSAPTLPALQARLTGTSTALLIDGALDESLWRDAPVHDTFYEYLPENGRDAPPALRTTVQLLIEDGALVFGIRAWDLSPEKRQGLLARRDKVAMDQDFIGIWLDPSGHGRAAQFVRVNTAGVLTDGIYRADEDESDLGPDFPIEAAVRLLPDGYSMEVRWPLASLRFPYSDGKPWRVMIERSVPHAGGMLLTSTPLKTGDLSHIAALQPIGDMGDTVESVRDRRFIELRPELTLRANDERSDSDRRRARQASLGLDINARPRADWVLNATINPDYSQVEIDEPTSNGASRIALSLPEKRGFFLESADVLALPLAGFYSRTVADPEWGLRATWRAATLDATGMSLRDQPGGVVLRGGPYETASFEQTGRTLASLLRARWHRDGLLLGAFASQRGYGRAGANNVLGFDGQWRGDGQQASWLLMQSNTSAGFSDEAPAKRSALRRGLYGSGKFTHISDIWWNDVLVEASSGGFVNDNGFVPQTGVVKITGNLNRRLGARHPAIGPLALELYEVEAQLGLHEMRTVSDHSANQAGGQVVERRLQPGLWFRGPRQLDFWSKLGFDQQRAHRDGRLHNTPALHFGFASSPLPWLSKFNAEATLGRQLDVDADRVGRGGNVTVETGMRFALARGWSVELDQRVNRAWVQGTLSQPAFADTGWRSLAMLHLSARDSLRLLAQNTRAARRDDGVSGLAPWADKQAHRSLLYRHLWRHGRTLSVGFTHDRQHPPSLVNKAVTVKFQWET
ncbi:DOMON domain-containing protein [Janthinobacterium aquaticum]|uniref:hypothetical protein n=1 Tax=Janthinobacterium sp. FT58W TaxID=2654254 RepID=UPI00186AD83C|nr:hypothetical protein [Janthinobacterium sp. FT58W]